MSHGLLRTPGSLAHWSRVCTVDMELAANCMGSPVGLALCFTFHSQQVEAESGIAHHDFFVAEHYARLRTGLILRISEGC